MRQFGLLRWAETRTLPLLFQEFHFRRTKQKLCNKAHLTSNGCENQRFLARVSFFFNTTRVVLSFSALTGVLWTLTMDTGLRSPPPPVVPLSQVSLWATKPSKNSTNKHTLDAVFQCSPPSKHEIKKRTKPSSGFFFPLASIFPLAWTSRIGQKAAAPFAHLLLRQERLWEVFYNCLRKYLIYRTLESIRAIPIPT